MEYIYRFFFKSILTAEEGLRHEISCDFLLFYSFASLQKIHSFSFYNNYTNCKKHYLFSLQKVSF